MADTDEKILKALEALQADVTAIKTEHGKQLTYLTGTVGTILQELQQQRTDLRYVQDDLDRIEGKVDKIIIDTKSDRERIENLEEHTQTPNPHKH